jgi:hypothetical protein
MSITIPSDNKQTATSESEKAVILHSGITSELISSLRPRLFDHDILMNALIIVHLNVNHARNEIPQACS